MACSESDGWETRVDVGEVVVVVCDMELALIFARIAVRVPDQASLIYC